MELSFITQINAFFMLIALIFVSLLAFHILVRAIKKKERNLYVLFITFSTAITPWVPGVIDYVFWLFTNDLVLSYELYIIIGTAFIPFAFLGWLYIYLSTVFQKKKYLIFSLYSIILILFEIMLFFYLYFAPNAPVMELLPIVIQQKLDHYYRGLILIFTIIVVLSTVVSGIHFGVRTIRTPGLSNTIKNIKWRGRFITIAFCFYIFTIPDCIIDDQLILLPMRILCMFIFFFLYGGFVMPKWLRKILKLER
ncbi:MAG: hypothetical protein GF353_05340 [Candidatus Lokiarchaeota archaeon]|nr:hypothetical protein [Candidatus Lokiarchaeota archaeon]